MGHWLEELPIERGEALKATGLLATRRLSIYFLFKGNSFPNERRAGLRSTARMGRAPFRGVRVLRARTETGPPARFFVSCSEGAEAEGYATLPFLIPDGN